MCMRARFEALNHVGDMQTCLGQKVIHRRCGPLAGVGCSWECCWHLAAFRGLLHLMP
jgi:hypothetical protein